MTPTPNTPSAEALEAFPFVWFNKDTEEYECKTDEAAKWFITHHNEILTALQAQGRTQSVIPQGYKLVPETICMRDENGKENPEHFAWMGRALCALPKGKGGSNLVMQMYGNAILSAAPPVTAPIANEVLASSRGAKPVEKIEDDLTDGTSRDYWRNMAHQLQEQIDAQGRTQSAPDIDCAYAKEEQCEGKVSIKGQICENCYSQYGDGS